MINNTNTTETMNENNMTNTVNNQPKMTLEEAVLDCIECYRNNAQDDELLAKWLWGQVNIPYHKLSKLALDQRSRMIRRTQKVAGLESLSEMEFSKALNKVVSDFFAENPILRDEAEFYFHV